MLRTSQTPLPSKSINCRDCVRSAKILFLRNDRMITVELPTYSGESKYRIKIIERATAESIIQFLELKKVFDIARNLHEDSRTTCVYLDLSTGELEAFSFVKGGYLLRGCHLIELLQVRSVDDVIEIEELDYLAIGYELDWAYKWKIN